MVSEKNVDTLKKLKDIKTKYRIHTPMPTQGKCYVSNVDQSIALQKYLLDCGFTWKVLKIHPDREYDIRSFANLVVSWSNFNITADFPKSTTAFPSDIHITDVLLPFENYFEIRPGCEGWETGLKYGL
jgi:hypothetical protein